MDDDEFVNWYDVLKVAPGSNEKAIKKAYYALSRKYHPDKNQDDPRASDLFVRVNKAFEFLSNPDQREALDKELARKERLKKRRRDQTATRLDMVDQLIEREKNAKRRKRQDHAKDMQRKANLEQLKRQNEARMKRDIEEKKNLATQDYNPLNATLKIKWDRKKLPYREEKINQIFKHFGPIDQIVMRSKGGSCLVVYKDMASAYKAMNKQSHLVNFTITWANGRAPHETSTQSTSFKQNDKKSQSSNDNPLSQLFNFENKTHDQIMREHVAAEETILGKMRKAANIQKSQTKVNGIQSVDGNVNEMKSLEESLLANLMKAAASQKSQKGSVSSMPDFPVNNQKKETTDYARESVSEMNMRRYSSSTNGGVIDLTKK
eukprot:CAMPEP_0168516510 /NCGR_PEP_ID=MMETSP0405-20121227/5449_1 /TAXON_ID=498012 /ORGANISM="Trichosphaerium sp, Strain Am-I-7 wt" /LENGTH=376 /DNA_ID=CAMNT_0008536243 /DNA_START=25 /DNA_END=1155 /DNA_ORIENTATION=+